MSVAHSGVSFNHSCLKVPVDPENQRPSPNYERSRSKSHKSARNTQKRNEFNRSFKETKNETLASPTSSLSNNYKSVESYLQFYENIPDYSELHHLSDEEFYSRLRSLKSVQKRFRNGSDVLDENERVYPSRDGPSSQSSYECNLNKSKYEKSDLPETSLKRDSYYYLTDKNLTSSNGSNLNPTEPKMKRKPSSKKNPPPPKINVISDSENISDLGYDHYHQMDVDNSVIWDKASINEFMSKEDEIDDVSFTDDGMGNFTKKSRSLPSSPSCKSKFCECQTPKICRRISQMSLRDKDSSIDPMQYHVHGSSRHLSRKEKRSEKKKKFHRPVPLLSRIPLYDKIMAEQEARRRIIHHRYSKELQALVQPFSFTKREEEEKQRIRSSCSNPDLNVTVSRPRTPFKAKPIPKNLFSNYAYERMREDEFYRALKKRIRAEEMLRSSSLPPSMAAREQKYRSKSLDFLDYKNSKKKRSKCRVYKRACEALRRELEFDENSKDDKPEKRGNKSGWTGSDRRRANSVTDSSADVSPYESVSEPERRTKSRPRSALSINGNNLASVLRIQTVRKRLEKEMADSLEESRLKEQAKFKERLVRMTPAWRSLNYSTEEDLAMRVAARREEERLRREHHQKLMGSIYGRVHQMPPLFQRTISPVRNRYQGHGKSQEEKCKNDIVYNGIYYDNESGNVKESKKDDDENEKDRSASPTGNHNGFRSRESSESIASQEKSEGTKLDESDIDTISHEDEIDDYNEAPGDGDEN